jgi:hypothetical protein
VRGSIIPSNIDTQPNFDKREGGKHRAPAIRISSLNVAQYSCVAIQTAQETSRLKAISRSRLFRFSNQTVQME